MSDVEYQRLPASLSGDRELVSHEQYVLLLDLEPDLPADFDVTEGHRTMGRQAHFWAGSPTNPDRTWNGNLAARPSPTAPHIKEGDPDHALDCIRPDALVREARLEGVVYAYTVPTEGWHIEPGDGQPAAYLKRERTRRTKAKRAAKLRVRRSRRAVMRATGKLKRDKQRLEQARRALKVTER